MSMGMTADGAFKEVSKAIIERLRPTVLDVPAVTELAAYELFWYPTSHPIPAMLIRPDKNKDRDYNGSVFGYTKYMLRLEFHVDATDEEAAHSEMSLLVSKRGPIIERLRDDEIRDALWDLCGQSMGLSDGGGWRTTRRKRLQADIGLTFGAN